MVDLYKRRDSKIFSKKVKLVSEFDGSNSFEVHMSGNDGSVSLVSLNQVNGTITTVNHTLKTIIYGADAPISIATLGNGYLAIVFRFPNMVTTMLVNPKRIGKLACTTYLGEHINSFGSISSDYKEYHARPFNVSHAANTKLRETIKRVMEQRIELAGNSFSLFCEEEDLKEFYTMLRCL